jgi:hypothetical protein
MRTLTLYHAFIEAPLRGCPSRLSDGFDKKETLVFRWDNQSGIHNSILHAELELSSPDCKSKEKQEECGVSLKIEGQGLPRIGRKTSYRFRMISRTKIEKELTLRITPFMDCPKFR